MKEGSCKCVENPVLTFTPSAFDITKQKPTKMAKEPPPTPISRDGEEWLEMEKIVGKREDLSAYKCRWKRISSQARYMGGCI